MPVLDLFTLEVFTTLNMVMAGAALFLVSSLNRSADGVMRCASSCVFFVAGFALFPARIVIPGKLIVLLPNLLVIAGCLILLDGVRTFRGLRPHRGVYSGAMTAAAAGLCFWTFVHDDINARAVVEMSAFTACAFFLTSALLTNVPRRDRGIYRVTAAAFAFHGIVSLGKGLDAVWGPTIRFWSPRPWDVVFAVTLNVCIIACAFGLSMAINIKLQRATEAIALYDSLTRLPNRRHFEESLERAQQRAFETGQRLALVYCDIDDFKGINDRLGHEGGDMALRLAANRLRAVIDEGVCLARVGGDEFLLLIENARSRDKIQDMIERLRNSVEGAFEFEGQSAVLKISCGLAIYPDDVESVSDLIRLADAAMYTVKQHGRSVPTRTAVGA